jgi:ABC-type uncharacterized transport system YnjBCD ATPase subunit
VSFTGAVTLKSLKSLSGGQRAVVALLFILALQEHFMDCVILDYSFVLSHVSYLLQTCYSALILYNRVMLQDLLLLEF